MKNPFDKILNWYFTKNSLPYWSILMIDCFIIIFSGLVIYWVFNNSAIVLENGFRVMNTLICFVLLSLPGFKLFHTYSGFMRFSSFVDLMRVVYGNLVSLGLVAIVDILLNRYYTDWFVNFSTTSIFLIYLVSTLLMWALRVVVKTLYDVAFSNSRAIRVLIYGMVADGVGLAKHIRSQRPRRYLVKGFITHGKNLKHVEVLGEKVYSVDQDIDAIIKDNDIEGILVSPSRVKDFRNNQALQDKILGAGAKIFMAEGAKEVNLDEDLNDDYLGNLKMREVSVEELLPRNEIRVDLKSVEELLKGTRVLITGSAGSIGSEMVRQVAAFKPAKMMLIDQAETPQHDIRLMMARDFPDIEAEVVVTSISRQRRMEEIFSTFRPDYVFHAAAYKHVPMMEDNPSEAVLNNIWGTKIIADYAVKYGVKKFVMISTDTAVNPTNVMGCSKRICEIYVQSLDQAIKNKRTPEYLHLLNNKQSAEMEKQTYRTQFVTTRFGNVLGSNGSVIPLFRQQIKNGGPVTVTDERIVRFFMLIPEACKLVLEAGTKGNGGEIFVFDMGQPVKIADLAKRMINLSGAKNVKIEYTGLRPGEKLYEEVLNEQEGTKPTFHEKIRIAEVREYDFADISRQVNELVEISKHYDDMETVRKMKEIIPEYKSNNSVYEVLDK